MRIGIDIGAQSTKFGIVDNFGTILDRSSIKSTQSAFEAYIQDLYQELKNLLDRNNISGTDIESIGIGAPNGNYYSGTIDNAVNLLWAKHQTINITAKIQELFSCPVALTKDANAAALGEMHYGNARGMKDFIMITLGTGVGSGIVINGNIVYGHDGNAGELGHICMVRYNGRLCGCGKHGCLETYTSAIGIATTAKETLSSNTDHSILRDIPFNKIDSKRVYDAAIKGDLLAQKIFYETGKMLGEAFANFVTFSSPEAIILFGGVTKSGSLILDPIVEHMNKNIEPRWRNKIKVLFSALPESDAAILGASMVTFTHKQ